MSQLERSIPCRSDKEKNDNYSDALDDAKENVIIILSDHSVNALSLHQLLIQKFANERNILKCVEHSPELAVMIGNDPVLYIAAIRFMDPERIFISEHVQSNRRVLMFALQRNGNLLKNLSEEMRRDRELVSIALKSEPNSFIYCNDSLKSDCEIVEIALENSLEYLRKTPLGADKEFVLKIVERNGYALEFVHFTLRNDKQVVLAAVKQNGFALEFAQFIDKEIALAAVKQNGNAIEYAIGFEDDEQVLKVAYGRSGYDALFEEELLLAKITKNPESLLDEDTSVRSDKKFMMKAVKSNPICIRYAYGSLVNDIDLALAALEKSVDVVEYLNEKMRRNRRVIFEVALYKIEFLLTVDEELMNDRDFALQLVDHVGTAAYYFSTEFKADKEIMLTAIRSNYYAISSADAELFKDDDFIETAVNWNVNVLGCLPRYAWHILQDKELIMELTRKNPVTLGFLLSNTAILDGGESMTSLTEDKELFMVGVEQQGTLIQYASDNLKNDKDLALVAVKQDGMALKYVSVDLRKDTDVVWEAVHQCEQAIEFVDESLRNDTDFMMKCAMSKVKKNNQLC